MRKKKEKMRGEGRVQTSIRERVRHTFGLVTPLVTGSFRKLTGKKETARGGKDIPKPKEKNRGVEKKKAELDPKLEFR